jgi:outer membrane lipoprotein-sorting protein
MRKTFYVLLILILGAAITTLYAQTLEEILEKNYEMMGQEKLAQVNSMTLQGKILQRGMEIPITWYQKRPLKFRSESSFQGMSFITVFDGEKGWSINPMTGTQDAQPLDEEQIDRMKDQADIDGILYKYKEKGYQLELEGTEEMEGMEVFVLKLAKPNGDVFTMYMDPENYVVLKTKAKIKVKGNELETESFHSNYKYVDDILIPFNIETKSEGQTVMQMIFDKVEFNTELSDSLFTKPSAN